MSDDQLSRDRAEFAALKKKQAKLAADILADKAKIAKRAQTRTERVRLTYLKYKDAIVRGDAVTVEQMTAAYDAALKVE